MIIDFLILFIALVFYCFWLFSFTFQSKKYFFFVLLFLTVFHDFIFINIGYIASESVTYVVKSWQEYLTLFLVFIALSKVKNGIKTKTFFLFIAVLLLTFWGVIVGIYERTSLFEVYVGWRSYILPILIGLLLLVCNSFNGLDLKYFYNLIVFIALIIVFGALYQKLLFIKYDFYDVNPSNKNFLKGREIILSNFWFFDKFGALHMLQSWPNYVREGTVRVTSLFVSPIVLAEFLVIPMIIVMAKILYATRISDKTRGLVMLISMLYVSYMTSTRIGILLALISLTIFFLLTKAKLSAGILWLFIVGILFSTFFSLIILNVGDDSAQGRLTQYIEMVNIFSMKGYGFGSPQTDVYFDSMYISVLMLFGAAAFIYFLLHLLIVQTIYSTLRFIVDINGRILSITAITLALSFSFAFAFHYSIGSGTISLLYFILFLAFSKNNLSKSK